MRYQIFLIQSMDISKAKRLSVTQLPNYGRHCFYTEMTVILQSTHMYPSRNHIISTKIARLFHAQLRNE